ALPWIVIINGGSASWYQFFVDPLDRPGLGQYLAQSANVLIVTIPGNFKYGGWTLPASRRSPQYLLDRDLSADEVKVRNAIYTNRMEIEGLRRLIVRETSGDILIIGHSTSGELGFLAMGEKELATRLKGRFLGWGSGGPSNLRKEREEQVGRRAANVKALAKYPALWELRPRDAEEYVNSGYIGQLKPATAGCAGWWASGIKPIGTRRPPRRPGSSPSRTSSGRGTPTRPSGSWFSICP